MKLFFLSEMVECLHAVPKEIADYMSSRQETCYFSHLCDSNDEMKYTRFASTKFKTLVVPVLNTLGLFDMFITGKTLDHIATLSKALVI